jgi:hypothetical protein
MDIMKINHFLGILNIILNKKNHDRGRLNDFENKSEKKE